MQTKSRGESTHTEDAPESVWLNGTVTLMHHPQTLMVLSMMIVLKQTMKMTSWTSSTTELVHSSVGQKHTCCDKNQRIFFENVLHAISACFDMQKHHCINGIGNTQIGKHRFSCSTGNQHFSPAHGMELCSHCKVGWVRKIDLQWSKRT